MRLSVSIADDITISKLKAIMEGIKAVSQSIKTVEVQEI